MWRRRTAGRPWWVSVRCAGTAPLAAARRSAAHPLHPTPPDLPSAPPGTAAILAVGGSKPVVSVDENGRIGVEKQVGAGPGAAAGRCRGWCGGRRGGPAAWRAGPGLPPGPLPPPASPSAPLPPPLAFACPPQQMLVNITCDHRVVYGAHAAEFLQTLKAVIESPDQLVF